MGRTNSITISSIISAIITGKPQELSLMKSVIQPNHGIRITTLPTTMLWGTPGGVLLSHGSKPDWGGCGHGFLFPFPSPLVRKYVVPLTVSVLIMRCTINMLGSEGLWKTIMSLFG